jgi:photoactive yellow protein
MGERDGAATWELTEQTFAGVVDPCLLPRLEQLDAVGLDELEFGVIRMNDAGLVVAYNAAESAATGLSSGKVIGRHFFKAVAPCMNNFMVADRFEAEPELDVTIDYLLTIRMRPIRARLRLLQSSHFPNSYVLIKWP